MLKIKNLNVTIDNKKIINNLNLTINSSEVHVIMGLNGTGKSTLLKSIAGSPETKSTGTMIYKNENLLEMKADERAKKGIFMSFQNPIEIPGVNTTYFLKTALNEHLTSKGEDEIKSPQFIKLLNEKLQLLNIDKSILQRGLNVGFSGGEKKRSEILQMLILQPELILLDEIDSGLDIDALKAVANGINSIRNQNRAIIMVTHYNRILEYVKPDYVHILSDGHIVKSGSADLAMELEAKGYEDVLGS